MSSAPISTRSPNATASNRSATSTTFTPPPDSFGFLETAVDYGVPDSLIVNASVEPFKRNVGLTAETVDQVSDSVLV